MRTLRHAVHRTVVVVDVEGFGDSSRTTPHQLEVREGLYSALRRAFDTAGIPWDDCEHEDRGDGVFVLARAELPKGPFVEMLPDALAAELRAHNATHPQPERIRLRMALHAGEVAYDEHGVTAGSVNLAFRLLDAPQLKTALAETPGVLALITSSWFFDEVVRHSTADPATFRPAQVKVKETTALGWIGLPENPYPVQKNPGPATGWSVPRQLPARTPYFAGREEELAKLSGLLGGGSVVISAINGTAGIGKTALAVHWAHQVADRFPDGQLYVNLRGFDPSGKPMSAADAVRDFLDAFEVPPERLPVNLDAQAALYRSMLADRRVLLVLDNARDAEQVRPLLPGSPTCQVVITSRNRLDGLVADGVMPVTLDVLTAEECRALLAQRLGKERLAAEPEAVTELMERCARLPLALSIVAARASAHPRFLLRELAEELLQSRGRLSALDIGDLSRDVRAVFSWSYRTLRPETARLFRLLGAHPGPDITVVAAASLAGVPAQVARTSLGELNRAHLLDEHVPSRFRFHDLLAAYAAEQAELADPEPLRREAARRLLDHYLHTGFAADRQLAAHRDPPSMEPPHDGVALVRFNGQKEARDWFVAEHANLLAVTGYAARIGFVRHSWQLSWALVTYFDRQGHWHDWAATQTAALASAIRLRDRSAEACSYRILGRAYTQLGKHAEACLHLERSIALCRELGEFTSQSHAHEALSWSYERQSRYGDAYDQALRALQLAKAGGSRGRQANALNAVGWNQARLGDYLAALENCELALELHRETGSRAGEAHTLHSLGYANHHAGRHDRAIKRYREALVLWREIGDRFEVADTLTHLGDAHYATGDPPNASDAWQQALGILEQLDHPDAIQLRAKLAALRPTS